MLGAALGAAPFANAADAAAQALNIGPLARAAAGLDDALRDRIRGVVEGALAKFAGEHGIAPPASCWLVGAGV